MNGMTNAQDSGVPRAANNVRNAPRVVAVDTPQAQQQQQQNNQFGAVRDRLFHAMLVRMALSYNRHVPKTARRLIECSCLLTALSLLGLMLYVHLMFGRVENTCLSHLQDTWPRDGVLRVEVINNLDKFNAYQEKLSELQQKEAESSNSTPFDLKRILMEGPKSLPKELRSKPRRVERKKTDHWTDFLSSEDTLLNLFLKPDKGSKKRFSQEDFPYEGTVHFPDYDEDELYEEGEESEATYEYVVEYSLHYGLLRLPHSYRLDHNIPFMLVRLDPETDPCFGDWLSRGMMKYLIGYEDVLMASVKALAENETDKGYLRDMITGEHYRFVTMGSTKASYLTAMFVMLIFTFAISMLLRFSHHQIFLFIVDLLQMFELNQALVFPAAPLLTVILALVGMEAIMSEVFNDTSTAFYVILLVWIADQYDAICCHSPISKRFWLRYFYLYHYAFYAYQYRYNGQYGGLALLTSVFFIVHSMIYFFHHYEMPLILYHERLQRLITDLQHNPPQQAAVGMNEVVVGDGEIRPVAAPRTADVQGNHPNNASQIVTSVAQRIAAELDINLASAAPVSRADGSLGAASSSAETPGNNVAAASEPGQNEQRNASESPGVTSAVDDPLLAAGERTASEIVENAMNDLFEP